MIRFSYQDQDSAFGQTMLSIRGAIGLTQLNLAEILGVSRRTIIDWESGNKFPTRDHLKHFITLAFEKKGFNSGHEAAEIRDLWDKARQKNALDEAWLSSLLATGPGLPGEPLTVVETEQPQHENPRQGSTSGVAEQHWGEAPDLHNFSGRETELAQLEEWLRPDSPTYCRVITVMGMGGIGKTSLTTRAGRRLATKYDYIFWRSLGSAPLLEEVLPPILRFFSGQSAPNLSAGNLNDGISLLITLMQQKRCLLILDNLETILQQGVESGHYRENYHWYGELIHRIAQTPHRSCLLLTSREKPRELTGPEGTPLAVQTLQLGGLLQDDIQSILEDHDLDGTPDEWNALIARYGGNPLALKMVSETIRETFGGEISTFLTMDAGAFGNVGYLLASQFERLTELERDLMYWLAIERESVKPATLVEDLNCRQAKLDEVQTALDSLYRRNLLEISDSGAEYTQQPVIREYVTDRLIEQVRAELNGLPGGDEPRYAYPFLRKFALMKARSKDYVRQSQQRLLIQPLLSLLGNRESQAAERLLRQALAYLQKLPPAEQGCGGGNIFNLLVGLGTALEGWDFSGVNLWHADLTATELRNVNMSRADLSRTLFTEGFNSIQAVAYSPDGQFFAGGTLAGEIKIWQVQPSDEQTIYNLSLDLVGHSDIVASLAYSPDGRFLVSGSYDRTARLWDGYSGENLFTLRGHTDTIISVAYSPDGRFVASASFDTTVRLWEAGTGRHLATLEGHSNWVWSIAFSPDGQMLASTSVDGTIRLWRLEVDLDQLEPEVYEATAILGGKLGWIWGIVFSGDGKSVFSSGEDGVIRQWSLERQSQLQTFQGHKGVILSLAISRDGNTILSGGADQTIRVWQPVSKKPLMTLTGHTAPIIGLAFHPDGQTFASASVDRSVRIWSAAHGEGLAILQGYTNLMLGAAASRNSSFLVGGSSNNRLILWEMTPPDGAVTGPAPDLIKPSRVLGYTGQAVAIAWSPAGRFFASTGHDYIVRLWQVPQAEETASRSQPANSRPRFTFTGHTEVVTALAVDPLGQVLASASADTTVRLWSATSGKPLAILRGHQSIVWAVAFSPDGKVLASGGNDGTVRLWDVASGQLLTMFECANLAISNLAFHPALPLLACGRYDGSIMLLSTTDDNSQTPLVFKGHQGTVWSVGFKPGAEPVLASGGTDGTVRLWNAQEGTEIAHFEHAGYVRSVAFTPDGAGLLIAGDGGTVKLWDITTRRLKAAYRDFYPFEGVNISGVRGLTGAQRATLRNLGAVEE